MKAAAGLAAVVLLVAVALPAGSQHGSGSGPRVIVNADVPAQRDSDDEIRSLGTTLILKFWAVESDQKGPVIEIRCATPDYLAAVTKKTGDFSRHLEVEGTILMLRDRQILLLYNAEVGSGNEQIYTAAQITGSAIMREGVEKVLVEAEETTLHATFAFEPEGT